MLRKHPINNFGGKRNRALAVESPKQPIGKDWIPEKIDFAVNTLLADGDILYIGTEKGLFIHKDGQLLQVLTDRNMLAACNRIMDICLNEDKTVLWLATVQGLFS